MSTKTTRKITGMSIAALAQPECRNGEQISKSSNIYCQMFPTEANLNLENFYSSFKKILSVCPPCLRQRGRPPGEHRLRRSQPCTSPTHCQPPAPLSRRRTSSSSFVSLLGCSRNNENSAFRVHWAQKKDKERRKGKGRRFCLGWGKEFIQFPAALAVLPRTILKNMMNSSLSFKSSWCNLSYY